MPLSFRGIYEITLNSGPVYIDAGEFPMVFNNILATNDVKCMPDSTELCLVDQQTKFLCRESGWYHFEISGHTINYSLPDPSADQYWIDISVKYQPQNLAVQVVRKFHNYTPGRDPVYPPEGRRFVVFRFNHYMMVNSKLWLENNKYHTFVRGPEQFKFKLVAYQYTR